MLKRCFFLAIFVLSLIPTAAAQSKDPREDASATEAQATMASLFGRGAKMPSIPHASGTLALPSFDSAGMTIDDLALSQAQSGDKRLETRD